MLFNNINFFYGKMLMLKNLYIKKYDPFDFFNNKFA